MAMKDPIASKGGTFYVPFPVLALASDGSDLFLAAGGGGSMAVKEVPNVVHAMTYSEATGKLSTIAALTTGKNVVVHLSFCPSVNLWLASKHTGCKILRLNREENTLVELCDWNSEEMGKEPEQNFARFSPDGSMVVTGGSDGIVKLWDMQKTPDIPPVLKRNCGTKHGEILDADFSADNKYLAACDAGGSCRVWEIARDDPEDGTVITWMSSAVPKTGKALIKLVRFIAAEQPGQLRLLLGGNGGRGPALIGIFTGSGEKLKEIVADKLPVKSLSLNPDSSRLVVGLMAGSKVVYSFPELRVIKKTKELHSLPAQSVVFVGETAISGSGDRDLHLLSVSGGGGGSPMTYIFILLLAIVIAGLMVMRIGIKGAALGQGRAGS